SIPSFPTRRSSDLLFYSVRVISVPTCLMVLRSVSWGGNVFLVSRKHRRGRHQMNTEFAAHIITAESDLAAGHPEVIVMSHDSETGEAFPMFTYSIIDDEDPFDLLRENGWRVLDHPSRVYTSVDVGYDVVSVEPAD